MAMNLGKLLLFSATHTFNLVFNPLHSNSHYNEISICPASTVMLLFSHKCFSSLLETTFVTLLTTVQSSKIYCLF